MNLWTVWLEIATTCLFVALCLAVWMLRRANAEIVALEGRKPIIDALYELKPAEDAVIFVDCNIVDFSALREIEFPAETPGGLMIPVRCRKGESVRDAFMNIPRAELLAMIEGRKQETTPFFEYLWPKDGPVVEGLEVYENVYAANQPQYLPLRTLSSDDRERRVLSRWALTPEAKAAIANGADIFLELMTFKRDLQPIRLAVGNKPATDHFRGEYSLPPFSQKMIAPDMTDPVAFGEKLA